MRVQPITDASVKVQLLAPSVQQPGRPFTLRYQLSEIQTMVPLTDVVLSHERLIHLIVVRQDLRHFQHLHPEPTGVPGEFALDLTFPEPGRYLLFIEFGWASGEQISQKDVLTVGSPSGETVALVEDWARKRSATYALPFTVLRPFRRVRRLPSRFTLKTHGLARGSGIYSRTWVRPHM